MRYTFVLAMGMMVAAGLPSAAGAAQPQARAAGRPAAMPAMHAPAAGPIHMAPRITPSTNAGFRAAPGHPAAVSRNRPRSLEDGIGSGTWTSAGFIPSHSGYRHDGDGRNRHRHVGYGYGVYGYGYPLYAYGTTYVGGDLNYDPNDPNNQPPAANVAAGAAEGPPPYAGDGYSPRMEYAPQDLARNEYRPAAVTAAPVTDGMGHPRVTLVFKDGRAPLEVQNYAATQTKIFVRDNGNERDIAISDLDVAATQAANDQAGVDFSLPTGH